LSVCVNCHLVGGRLLHQALGNARTYGFQEKKAAKTGFFRSGRRSCADYRRFDGENRDIRNFWCEFPTESTKKCNLEVGHPRCVFQSQVIDEITQDTTRACSVYLRGVAFKRLHVSAFLLLGNHQVVSSLSRKLYNVYNTICKI